MWWSNILFLVVGAFLGAGAKELFQHWSEYRKKDEDVRFKIYMMLLDLNSRHFSIASADMHGTIADPSTRLEFHKQCWRIADELRKYDGLPETEEILRVLFGLNFENEIHRSRMLGDLIDRLGSKVNPRYAKFIKKISLENQRLMAENREEAFRRQKKIEGSLLELVSIDTDSPIPGKRDI